MRVDFSKNEIVLNNVEANFIDKLNAPEKRGKLVTLSVYWGEDIFSLLLTKVLKLEYKGCRMDKECYSIPEDFQGVNLSNLNFSAVVTACGFTEDCVDFADSHEGYNKNYKITASASGGQLNEKPLI